MKTTELDRGIMTSTPSWCAIYQGNSFCTCGHYTEHIQVPVALTDSNKEEE